MDRLLLRPAEAAETIGVSRAKMYELLANGSIPKVVVGASVRIPVDGLKEWIQNRMIGGDKGATV